MKHPYADILIAIAEGKEIQYQYCSAYWRDMEHGRLLKHLAYDAQDKPAYTFRIKPATITINGVECEAPTLGYHGITIQANELNGHTKHIAWDTKEARDAAYAALILPFGEAK